MKATHMIGEWRTVNTLKQQSRPSATATSLPRVSASVIDTISATGADSDRTVNALQQHSRRPATA
ncbi:hypothetical protein A2U01_0112799, partial [Trifolium medium]|nr:hypothetical protein [Trifolium medium]